VIVRVEEALPPEERETICGIKETGKETGYSNESAFM
jgi:hypothetical protein